MCTMNYITCVLCSIVHSTPIVCTILHSTNYECTMGYSSYTIDVLCNIVHELWSKVQTMGVLWVYYEL